VVLWRGDPLKRSIEIHTNVRSPKEQALLANPFATILGFGAQTRLPLRLDVSHDCMPMRWAEKNYRVLVWKR
jgi:hypothetical protein